MNKGGSVNLVWILVIMLIANAVVFAVLTAFVMTKSSDSTIIEQAYAKQIGLLVNGAKPGTTVEVDILELYRAAEKNKFNFDSIVFINNVDKEVKVQLNDGKGYVYSYFNDVFIDWHLDEVNRNLVFEVRENV